MKDLLMLQRLRPREQRYDAPSPNKGNSTVTPLPITLATEQTILDSIYSVPVLANAVTKVLVHSYLQWR